MIKKKKKKKIKPNFYNGGILSRILLKKLNFLFLRKINEPIIIILFHHFSR